MNYRMIGRFMSRILMLEALFMVPPLGICLYDGDYRTGVAFMISIVLAFVIGGILWIIGKKAETRFQSREGLVCVGLSWIVLALIGCLPFFLSGEIPNYIDALFEIVSGFTTTGASILPEVESHTRGMLYWRSFSHWLGGMGVLVFLLAVARKGQKRQGFTMYILRAESPGPNVGKLVPKMKETARILYVMYIALTILNIIFLLLGGMPLFDSLCTSFGTAGTGGFGIKNDSIGSYSSYLQNVCTVFMFLFGVNFSCYYLLLIKEIKSVFKDEELRLYVGIFLGSIALISWNIFGMYDTLGETVRHAAFQVSSIMTTTGFATTDFDMWPTFSKSILVCLMFCGACAGSTGGGIKVSRVLLLGKSLKRNIRQMLQPRKVMVVRSNGQKVDEKILANVNAYLAAYVIIIILSFLVVSLDGFSLTTSFTSVVACFNNIGPGLDLVGPIGNYAMFGPLSKIVLILDMLAGRLEIFPILILFTGRAWKKM
ncbi:MAG: TrkH family potassium uptake protein [Lachnospiraceae bacterium]